MEQPLELDGPTYYRRANRNDAPLKDAVSTALACATWSPSGIGDGAGGCCTRMAWLVSVCYLARTPPALWLAVSASRHDARSKARR